MSSLSFAECTARQRIDALFDQRSFGEWLPPMSRITSPHLAQLGLPSAFDDGVAVGVAALDGYRVFVAAQEGEFMGGGVGEVHGAKLVGIFRRAAVERPDAVVVLADTGGVRLHEANAGLIAVSEVMRAVLDARAAGIATIFVIGSSNGCFGGMGVVAQCADLIVMSDLGRLGMSGPEVIESANGVDEFDSRDRALVWRTTGGKHRYITDDAQVLVEDDVAAFRHALIAILSKGIARQTVSREQLEVAQRALEERWEDFNRCDSKSAEEIWSRCGVSVPSNVPESSVSDLCQALGRVECQ